MKRALIFAVVSMVAATVVLLGCKKENDEVDDNPNQVSIRNNVSTGVTFNGVYSVSDGYHIGSVPSCSGTMYKTQVMVTLTPGATLVLYFWRPTSVSDLVPAGTHTLFTGTCQQGVTASFLLSGSRKAVSILDFSSGTVSVTKTGEVYDIDFTLTIDAASGGGTLKGNYNGDLPYVVGK